MIEWWRRAILLECLAGLALIGYLNPDGRAPVVEAIVLPCCALLGAGLGWLFIRSGEVIREL